jgi:plastocyanin
MHYFNFLIFLFPVATFATQQIVEVGDDGKFVYNPNTIQAAVGDTIVFEFYPGGHSVAQSTFDQPCQPAPNGFWSGFFTPSSGIDSNVFEITINDTNPIWIYCAQIGHCNSGMAMVINPP